MCDFSNKENCQGWEFIHVDFFKWTWERNLLRVLAQTQIISSSPRIKVPCSCRWRVSALCIQHALQLPLPLLTTESKRGGRGQEWEDSWIKEQRWEQGSPERDTHTMEEWWWWSRSPEATFSFHLFILRDSLWLSSKICFLFTL